MRKFGSLYMFPGHIILIYVGVFSLYNHVASLIDNIDLVFVLYPLR